MPEPRNLHSIELRRLVQQLARRLIDALGQQPGELSECVWRLVLESLALAGVVPGTHKSRHRGSCGAIGSGFGLSTLLSRPHFEG